MNKDKKFISNFIWNILGTGLNAFTSLFFMATVTRVNGLEDAGIFTLAFSTACILFIVGVYAGRVFQVTEANEKVTNKDYIINRVICCAIMLLIGLGFVAINRYDGYKASIFILLTVYKCLEAFSDVFYGILHKNDNLSIVGKSYFTKSIISIILFVLIDYFTKNMILSCVAIIVTNLVILLIYDIRKSMKYVDKTETVNKESVINIFKNGFFPFAISLLGLYIINAPKYAIDGILTEDIQAIFGIIVMPATVISLFAQFLIHPFLNKIFDLYKKRDKKEFNKVTNKLTLYITGFGAISSVLAFFLGTQVLSLVYGVDLNGYQYSLLAIIIAATLYTIGILYSAILTTLRKTFPQFIIYVIISIIAIIISNPLVEKFQMNGAVVDYFLIMFIYFIMYVVYNKIAINKIFSEKGEEQNG